MATKTFKVALSLDNPRIVQTGITVQSFDKESIKISISLTKDSQTYQIPTGAQIKISLLKLARQEQKIILDVPFTSPEAIEWLVPDYLDGYQGEVRVGVYLIVGTENIDLGYFNITSSVSDIDNAAEEFTESVMQGWAIEDLIALQPQFQAVLDETTGKDVISAPEIILARGGATTLGERLDSDKAEVTAQLAQTVTHTELDVQLATLLDGGPSIFMDSLALLQSTYPNGASGVALVRETNPAKIYVWDGSVWKDFGDYQGIDIRDSSINESKLKDGAVTPRTTTFFIEGRNLLNLKDPTMQFGKGYRATTSEVVDSPSTLLSGRIPVLGNQRIMISENGIEISTPTPSPYKIISLNGNTWLSTKHYVEGGVTTSPNATHMIVHIPSNKERIQVEFDNVTPYVPFFEPYIKPEAITIPPITPSHTTFFTEGRNLFNVDDPEILINKGYKLDTSNIVDSTIYNISGKLNITGGENVLISSDGVEVSNPNMYKVISYSVNDTWLSTQLYKLGGVLVTPSTAYVKIQYDNTAVKLQVEIGEVTEYMPFSYLKISNEYIDNAPIIVSPWDRFTSYGDSLVFRNRWQPHVVEHFGFNHTNLGIGSTTLAYVEQHEATYPSFTNASRIQAVKDSNPDIIVIMGGANDAHRNVTIGDDSEFDKELSLKDKTNFKGAYSWIVETLLEWKPNLVIVLMTMNQTNYTAKDYKAYADATVDTARYYALPLIDLYHGSGINKMNLSEYTIDGLHHSSQGGSKVGSMVISAFEALAK